MEEKISVIVPVYKVEKYINRCIDSILNQTYKNIEIILVDDGSPDNCGEICDKYAEKDNRIKVFHKKNEGVSIARNIGIENANGSYITFVDSDDYIGENYLLELYRMCIDNKSEISICGFKSEINNIIIDNKKIIKKKMNSKEALKELFKERIYYGNVWAKMFKRNIIENIKFDHKLEIGEDLDFCYQSFKKAENIYVDTSKMQYYYFVRNNSVTTEKYSQKWKKEIELCENIIGRVKKDYPNIEGYAIKRYIRINYSCIINLLKNDSANEKEYQELKNNILKYKQNGIYKKSTIFQIIKLWLVLYQKDFIIRILKLKDKEKIK